MMPLVGVATFHAEGDRFAAAVATPHANWLACTDPQLERIFRRLNDRAWAQRWKAI